MSLELRTVLVEHNYNSTAVHMLVLVVSAKHFDQWTTRTLWIETDEGLYFILPAHARKHTACHLMLNNLSIEQASN